MPECHCIAYKCMLLTNHCTSDRGFKLHAHIRNFVYQREIAVIFVGMRCNTSRYDTVKSISKLISLVVKFLKMFR